MRIASFIVVIGVVAWESLAVAQPTAVVLEMDGRGGDRVRSAVVRAAGSQVNLQPLEDFTVAAEELGADLGTDDGIAEVAESLEIELVVSGSVTGGGRRARARIRMLGADGSELEAVRVRAPTDRATRRAFGRALAAALGRAIASLGGPTPEDAQSEAEEEEAEEEEAGAEDDASADHDANDDDTADEPVEDDDGEHDDGDGDDADGSRGVFPTGGSRPMARLLVGVDGRHRQATFALDTGLERGYEAFFPHVSLALEVRPLSFLRNHLAGLFVSFDGAIAVALGSSEELPSGAVVPIETQAYRFAVALGYLLDLGALELGVSAGLAYETFELSANDTFPSSTYLAMRPGLSVRIPIFDWLLVAYVDGGVRLLFDTGDLTPALGEETTGLGFDATAGVTGALDVGFIWAVRVGYVGYSVSFQGTAIVPDDTAVDGFDGGVFFGAQLGWEL